MKKLIIISNDKLYFEKKDIYSDFNDTINIIESLSKKNYLYFFSRKSKTKGIYKAKTLNKSQLKISHIKSLNLENKKIFMISITPYSFLIFLLINFFHKNVKGFVILRSDGYKEYCLKFGFFAKYVYGFFFNKILKKLKPIVVTDNLTNVKNYKRLRVYPSEITSAWNITRKKAILSRANLLYLGRVKKEKGIFSLINIIENLKIDFNLDIVGDNKNLKIDNKNIRVFQETSDIEKIINFYDKNNIFILPSFTEGFPKVILESLSRLRPVIVFREIAHVKSIMNGIFIANRNTKDLQKTIIYVLNNYKNIQSQMKKNKLPTKKKFQLDLIRIVK